MVKCDSGYIHNYCAFENMSRKYNWGRLAWKTRGKAKCLKHGTRVRIIAAWFKIIFFGGNDYKHMQVIKFQW